MNINESLIAKIKILDEKKTGSSKFYMSQVQLKELNITEQEFEELYSNDTLYMSLFRRFRSLNAWDVRSIYYHLVSCYPSHSDKILGLKTTSLDFLQQYIVQSGYYSNINSIDVLTYSPSKTVRKVSATVCSIERCKELIKDKEVSVRKIAYTRLGPVGFLDKMLQDRHATIRAMGVRLAPFGYPKLRDMIGDRSQSVIWSLVDKVDLDCLPHFLSDKRYNSMITTYIKEKIQTRFDLGV
jgi:hypothetical protein